MDQRDSLGYSGSPSYYVHQGISSFGLHGSSPMHSLSIPNMLFQSNTGGYNIGSTLPPNTSTSVSPHRVNVGPLVQPSKRKRGRPRKYGPEGTVSLALSPLSSTYPVMTSPTQKRGRGRPPGTGRKQHIASLGEWVSSSAGTGFTPHIITVEVGEDISTKIMSFSQQRPRAMCIFSANGVVSNVTLCQPSTSSGGTVTYEGRFQILCLSGSYLVSNNGGSRNRIGGLSVSLSSPDGRVIGGGVGGMLIAATLVQVIIGSFIWCGSKTEIKNGEGLDCGRDAGHENPTSQSAVIQSHNLNPTSSVRIWPCSRQIDMSNVHVDVDLMHG